MTIFGYKYNIYLEMFYNRRDYSLTTPYLGKGAVKMNCIKGKNKGEEEDLNFKTYLSFIT